MFICYNLSHKISFIIRFLHIMPTLLQIDSCLGILSTGKITESIGRLARNKGWDCHIAHGARYVGKSQMKSMQVVSKSGEYMHYFKSLFFDAHGLGSTMKTRKLIQKISEINPDIIHLHCIHGYYLNYKVLFEYLSKKNIPVVWTFHDCWSLTGHCAHFDSVGCDKWKKECHDCPLKGTYPKSLFVDASTRNFRLKKKLFTSVPNLTIVSVSQWLADIVKESFMSKYPVEIINNGVDIDIFKPIDSSKLRNKLGIGDKCILLGVATAWHNEKGLREFIHLSENPEYQVIMVGVPTEIKKNLPKEIIAIERTNSQQELAEYYSMAHMLVNPTYNDSFPTVNLEALACGTPVVTFRTGGSPESITPETGIVVEKGNYRQLVDAIEAVRRKGKVHYSTACRERAETMYNKEEKFADYIKLYEKLVGRN